MVSKEALAVGGVVGGAVLVGGVAVASGLIRKGVTNTHDFTGKTVDRVDIEFNEPVNLFSSRVRGRFVIPEGLSNRDTAIHVTVGAYFGESIETADITTIVEKDLPISEVFDTGTIAVEQEQQKRDAIAVFVTATGLNTGETVPMKDMVFEITKSKQVGSSVSVEFAHEIVEFSTTFGNGEAVITFDKPKTIMNGSQYPVKINLTTTFIGVDTGSEYVSGNLTASLVDENRIPILTITDVITISPTIVERVLGKSIVASGIVITLVGKELKPPTGPQPIPLAKRPELLKIEGTITFSEKVPLEQ